MEYSLKKSLGQHFLKDEQISRNIVNILTERPVQRLLEVGPGGGALTKYLMLPDVEFKCIEIDIEKVEWLQKNYPQLKGKIIHGNILETDPPFSNPFTLIGNFPYNISSQIVFRVLEWKDRVECMIGMFQKEVAERIASKEGSRVYGVTSVLVQAFFTVDYLFEVEPESFTPPPKIKSAVIRLLPRDQPLPMKSERALFVLVKAAFNQRRKTLRNAVKGLFDASELSETIFNRRAEQLSVAEFSQLTFKMK